MNRRVVFLLVAFTVVELALIGALFVFFRDPPEAPPEPTAAPLTPDDLPGRKPLWWDDQRNGDWVYAMPYKADMRHLWIDCNRLVSAGRPRGNLKPTWAEIITATGDIARRAGSYETLWQSTADRFRDVLDTAEDAKKNDWLLYYSEMIAAWNTCNECHLATWSPAYLHVTPGFLEAWTGNEIPSEEADIVTKNPPPAIPNRHAMRELQDAFDLIDNCFAQKDPAKVDETMVRGAKIIIRVAEQRATYWRTIREQAEKIRGLADDTEIEGMEQAYNRMTAQCAACHAVHIGETREILTPMTWSK